MTTLALSFPRLRARLDALAEIGAFAPGGVARLALTDADKDARDLVVTCMRDLGLRVDVDGIGNIVGTWPADRHEPPVLTGSHIDSVVTGGIYDGALGVLAGLEIIETVAAAGVATARPLAVGVFTDEEGSRFAPDMLGSLVYVGGLALETALDTRAVDGAVLHDELVRIGARLPGGDGLRAERRRGEPQPGRAHRRRPVRGGGRRAAPGDARARGCAVSRELTVAAAQMGPIARAETRTEVVQRLLALLRDAAARGAELVVFPELALTTFFPRWDLDDDEMLTFFEREMPSDETRPLFEESACLGVGFHLGYAELTDDGHRYNSAVVVGRDGNVVARYRRVHLPGHEEPEGWRPFQHLERKYFEPGPDGFHATKAFGGVIGVALCNDRRWSETYRVLGLQGVELLLVGYNTPVHYAPDPGQDHLQAFHNNLVMASGAYQNGMFVVGVAKAGVEEGVELLADSQIIAPSGEVIARAETAGDELVVATIDLDDCDRYKQTVFDFQRYRRPSMYGPITSPHAPPRYD